MEIIRGVESASMKGRRVALSIGNFDGVHLAHRHICRITREEAARRRGGSVVLTFEPHPLSVVAPERCPPLMTPLDEKLARLEEQGLDAVIVQPFTAALAATEARDFIRNIVVAGVGAEVVIVGFNFHFGKNRAGNVDLLREEGARGGFGTRAVEPFFLGDRRVSSTEIRRLLLGGEVEEAARFLGQRHVLEGEVVQGEGRGRRIGIPTANLAIPPGLLVPANGVYASWVQTEGRGGRRLPAVTNVGDRPTFGGDTRTVETHLLEGGCGLYGRLLRVEFVSRLREERKFPGPEALVAQIRADIEEGKKRLSAE